MPDYPEMADPQKRPRYTGIPTFFRAPYTEDLSEVDIALVGVPYDGGVTNRPGARHGPREVRNQSSLIRTKHATLRVAPFEQARVRDIGDAWVERPFALEGAHAEIEAVFRRVHAAGALPLSVGGDHSITLPIFRAIAAERPVGMVHIDAHCDTGDDYLGSRHHHGAPFRRAVEEGLLDPTRTIQIGIRGTVNDYEHWAFSRDSGMRVVEMDEVMDRPIDDIAEEARSVAGDGPTYLSFDIDSLDPTFAPGTGTPEAGGLNTREAMRLVRGLRGVNFVGGDLVEVAPPFDVGGLTALAAASVLFEMLAVVVGKLG
jgi:guanidinopropionase